VCTLQRVAVGVLDASARNYTTRDLIRARDGDSQALDLQEVTTIVYGLLMAGHETTTSLLGTDRTLMAQPFDDKQLEIRGQPFPIAEQVRTSAWDARGGLE